MVDYRAHQLIDMFGPPDDFSATKMDDETGRIHYGYAIWRDPVPKDKGFPRMDFIRKIMLSDDIVLHDGHIDFMYVKIEMSWTDTETRKETNMISEGIHLTRRKYKCVSGCHSLSSGLVGLFVAWKTAKGIYPAWAARHQLNALMELASEEIEKREYDGEEFKMPLHETLIGFLQTMYVNYMMESDIGEERLEKRLIALESATNGGYLYQTQSEITDMLANKTLGIQSIGSTSIESGSEKIKSSLSRLSKTRRTKKVPQSYFFE